MAKSPKEQRKAQRAAAMPEVKKLVRRFGRTTIAACLSTLKDHEKGVKRLNDLKKEVARLERAL